jgi:hypothetical protein
MLLLEPRCLFSFQYRPGADGINVGEVREESHVPVDSVTAGKWPRYPVKYAATGGRFLSPTDTYASA